METLVDKVDLPADAIDTVRAAKILRSSRSLVYRLVRQGRLRGWQVAGTKLFVSEAEVRALITVVVPDAQEAPRTPEQMRTAAAATIERLRQKGYRV